MKKLKPFKIFKSGTHTDSVGNQITFTSQMLQDSINSYNSGDWKAPLVIGHPTDTAPAYGWIEKLSLNNDEVIVDNVDKLNQDFAELMQNGAYRNRSVSWYAPDHPSNPTPGVWQIRHLGLLGATPPALKGLGDVSFKDKEGIIVNYQEDIVYTIEEELIYPPIGNNMTKQTEEKVSNFEELQKINALEKENESLINQIAEFAEREQKLKFKTEVQQVKEELTKLVNEGKLLPNLLNQTANFIASIQQNGGVYEFSEGDESRKLNAKEFIFKLISSLPQKVEYKELTADEDVIAHTLTAVEIGQKARNFMKEKAALGITLTATQAVDAIMKGDK